MSGRGCTLFGPCALGGPTLLLGGAEGISQRGLPPSNPGRGQGSESPQPCQQAGPQPPDGPLSTPFSALLLSTQEKGSATTCSVTLGCTLGVWTRFCWDAFAHMLCHVPLLEPPLNLHLSFLLWCVSQSASTTSDCRHCSSPHHWIFFTTGLFLTWKSPRVGGPTPRVVS